MNKPHDSGDNQWGLAFDNNSVNHNTEIVNPIPDDVLQIIKNKLDQITHGSVNLKIQKHDNHCRYIVGDEISIVHDVPMSGSVHKKASIA